ncbi:hypothetical protein [Myxococcus xanthus]|uniref:hypothetical protein n=1 Tax=Myxococcus xanthus TaxID=34 RepID=UPI001375DE23|nr:hypothetical protein [Myxococcus xanthus]
MGKLEFHDRHAFVAVSKRVAKMALPRLSEGHKHRIERVRQSPPPLQILKV